MTAANNSRALFNSPLNILAGIGPKTAKAFAKLNVFTLEDLFFLFPRRYEDRRFPKPLDSLTPGNNECALAAVSEIEIRNGRTEALITDSTGEAKVVWFTDKIGEFLREGMRIALYGPVNKFYSVLPQFSHPQFEILKSYRQEPKLIGKIFPVYPATAELSQNAIRKFVDTALKNYAEKLLKEFLPENILNRFGMLSFYEAVLKMHNPDDPKTFIRARNRLAFDELFLLQAGINLSRRAWRENTSSIKLSALEKLNSFIKNLPFKLTHSQLKSIKEIISDLSSDFPMNRLLQGDVGSGKTLVAIAAMIVASDSGAQSAFMAPTEILAQQHYITLKKNLDPLGLKISLLTGSVKQKDRRKILEEISSGESNIIIGTHAIFSEGVEFNNLALVIIDEQHRFGVLQRNELISKGRSPHVLAMTATPIPRTLILSIYGDLEVSTLRELPAGRKKIKTASLRPTQTRALIKKILEEIKKGHQVYWVCPLIEESERELHSVNEIYSRLKNLMPDLKIEVLHGQLPIEEKSSVMQNFSEGRVDLLICTTVIEVGVDVPNATVIVIQDAGQFGLAQLHQLRGRVGRGSAQSFCILLENASMTPEGQARLSSMVNSSDGFELAEMDLIQRGPGEVCGTHQHGVTDFRVADLVKDEKILELARSEANNLMTADPDLKSQPLLKKEIIRRLGHALDIAATS
ncbi:MAG: ATP-dependent DNA helicase RecG [Synergistaceae bacterium]|nr:ATP-dependent DNA helicase RecG [Synergistaceae bacterium]